MSGWIRLQRGTLSHHAFARPPFSEAEAWIWLIEKAAFKDTRHRIANQVFPVPTGSLYCTLRGLAKEWHWKSDFKVRKFLELLESENMIIRDNTQNKTHITICNYSVYQDAERKHNANTTQSERTKETNKQINNITLLGGREAEFYAALGDHYQFAASYPSLLVLSEPINWISNGCDIDLDILPTVKALSSRATRITTWAYFSKAVYEAKAKRTAPAPDVTAPIQRPANTRASRESAVFEKFRNMANENKPHLKLIEGNNG